MLCFEVYRNGEKLCTAGVGDYGVLAAIVTWGSHHPEKWARWVADGVPESEREKLSLSVGGLHHDATEHSERLKWLDSPLSEGDEIRIRIIRSLEPDPPSQEEEPQ